VRPAQNAYAPLGAGAFGLFWADPSAWQTSITHGMPAKAGLQAQTRAEERELPGPACAGATVGTVEPRRGGREIDHHRRRPP